MLHHPGLSIVATGRALLLALLLAGCGGGGGGGGHAAGSSSSSTVPWQSQDIGTVGIAGATSPLSSGFQVTASGNDIWDLADAFRFVYKPLSGDGEIVAQVDSLDPTDAWAKAGVMIRETLAA